MKFYFCFILIAIFIANAAGWVARGNYFKADNPGKCTFTDQLIISPGEKADHPETCARISCDDEEGNVSITGCGARGTPPNCKWGEPIDKDASYPECCDKHLICENVDDQIAYENMQNIKRARRFIDFADIKPF